MEDSMIKRSFLMTMLILSPLSYATEEKATAAPEVVCSKDNEKRILTLVKEGSGCKVDYKRGEEEIKTIGTQKNGIDFCESLIERVKTKLTQPDTGFQCN